MEFSRARHDVVRAIHQRWLLKLWHSHLGSERVPRWQSVEPENLTAASGNLSFLDVTPGNGGRRFQIRFHGTMVGEVYGSADCRGRYLDEVMAGHACSDALMPYHHAVDSGCPVYTILHISDRNDRLIHYERLLLPFSRDGQRVDRILASFEFFCPDGAFDTHELMRSQSGPPTVHLLATLEPTAAT